MSHITYNEFRNRFGDLGITYYVKYNWLANHGFPKGYRLLKGARFSKNYDGYVELPNYRLGTSGKYTLNVNALNDVDYSYNSIFCSSLSSDTFECWCYTNLINFRTDGATAVRFNVTGNEKTIILEYSPTQWSISIEGVTRTVTGTTAPTTVGKTLALGGYGPGNTPADYELSSFIIEEGGRITHCYVPIANEDDDVYIYDMVTGGKQMFNGYIVKVEEEPPSQIINPAIKIEGELGRFLNAQGEWTTGSTSLGAFKYEVSGGHTYDVINAKVASSSYIMFLDANGNRIGNVVALTNTNFPKSEDGTSRPMTMPSNCKYVWLVMASSNVNLPIPLIS